MFFLRKLNVDRYVLQLFYEAVLQSILPFGMICAFGKHAQPRPGRRGGSVGVTRCQLLSCVILSKAKYIINDPAHSLHNSFRLSCRSNGRILQWTMTTARFSKSFVPSVIRHLTSGLSVGICNIYMVQYIFIFTFIYLLVDYNAVGHSQGSCSPVHVVFMSVCQHMLE